MTGFGGKDETKVLGIILLASGTVMFVAALLFVAAWVYRKKERRVRPEVKGHLMQ